jgi:hypothetical protein
MDDKVYDAEIHVTDKALIRAITIYNIMITKIIYLCIDS